MDKEQIPAGRKWWQMTRAEIAGWLSGAFFVLLAIGVAMQKEPPGFAYIALLVFGSVPIALLIKDEIVNLVLTTPSGPYSVTKARNSANDEIIGEFKLHRLGAEAAAEVVEPAPDEADEGQRKLAEASGEKVETTKHQGRRPGVKSAPAAEPIWNGQVIIVEEVAPYDAYSDKPENIIGKLGTVVGFLLPKEDFYYTGRIRLWNSSLGPEALNFAGVRVRLLPKSAPGPLIP